VKVDIVREIPERSDSKPPKKETVKGAHLTISDNMVMLNGPGTHGHPGRHIANGEVVQTSTAYRGAEHHISMRVDVVTSGERTFGFRRRELWWVTFRQEEKKDT